MCNVAKNDIPKVIFYFVQLFKKILYYFDVLNIFKITRVKKICTFWRWVNFTLIKHKIFEGVNSLFKGWIIIKPPHVGRRYEGYKKRFLIYLCCYHIQTTLCLFKYFSFNECITLRFWRKQSIILKKLINAMIFQPETLCKI